jgi:membrane protease YdiL (CAAX protease family)
MSSITTILLASIVGIIYPLYIVATHKRVNENIKNNEKYRLIDYKQTLIIFWGLTILILVNSYFYSHPELSFTPKISFVNIIISMAVIGFAYFQYTTTRVSEDSAMVLKEKLKDIYYYLPKNDKELKWFLLLSISAGICEEIIFRLFMFEFLNETTHLIIAFVLTNLIFSLTHIGSGKKNLSSSFILGLLFSVIYYFTNNIWIAIILHISIDINVGILGCRIQKTLK